MYLIRGLFYRACDFNSINSQNTIYQDVKENTAQMTENKIIRGKNRGDLSGSKELIHETTTEKKVNK
jgi:hypothetical protein